MYTPEQISSASRAELIAMQAQIDRQIKITEVTVKRDALKKVKETARELGFSLEELLNDSAPAAKEKAAVVAKYRNPENAEQTWTGRGRKPQWVSDALANGGSLEAMLIAANDQGEAQGQAA